MSELTIEIPETVRAQFHRPGTLPMIRPVVRMQGWTSPGGITWSTWVVEAEMMMSFHESRFESWDRIFKTLDLRRAGGIDTLPRRR